MGRETRHSSTVTSKTPGRKGAAPPHKILIVDDEPTIVEFVDRVLQDAGYATVTATDAGQALALWAVAGPFSLLLTDVVMPQMTGDELARRIRQHAPDLKVLYLTGFSDRLFASKNTMWEGEAFLDKPPSINGLREAVSMALFGRLVPEARGRTFLHRLQSVVDPRYEAADR
jgi:CheY-like chemotaxis protein